MMTGNIDTDMLYVVSKFRCLSFSRFMNLSKEFTT